jgi:fibronectin-binding autotransporter adhesin
MVTGRFPLCALIIGLLAAATANSQVTYTWIGQTSDVWSNSSNWQGGVTPPAGGDPTGIFRFVGSGTAASITATDDILGALSVNRLVFDSSLTGGFTLAGQAGNTLQLTGANAAIQQTGLGNVSFASSLGLFLSNNVRISGVETFGLGSITIASAIDVGTNTLTIGNGATGNAPTHNTRVIALTGQNNFDVGGGVVLDGGNLSFGGTGANNSSLGGTGGTFTVSANGGTLQASTTITSLALATVQLNGELQLIGTSGITLTDATMLSGSGNLTLRNTNNLTIQSNSNSYTGAVSTAISRLPQNSSTGGTITLSGTSGSLTGVSSFVIGNGGTLALTSAVTGSTVNDNRIGDTATVALLNGNLSLTGSISVGTSNTETIGALSGAGYNIVTATPNTTGLGYTALTAASLSRVDRGTFLFRGTALGSAGLGNVGNVLFTTAPTGLVGGGGAAGSTNINILPYAIGDTSGTGTGTTTGGFVTYDVNGIRPLAASEYQLNSFAGTNSNVRLTAATANAGTATVNALQISTGGSITGAGTLNVTSGAILSSVTNTISNNIGFGAAEGLIYTTANTTTIAGAITGSNGLTKSGTGTLTLTGDNTGLTGQLTLNRGTLIFNSLNALPGTGQIVASGAGSSSTILRYSGASPTTLARDVRVADGWLTLDSSASGSGLTLSGVISGNGGLFTGSSSGVSIVELTGNNTYTGPTRVNEGILQISSDANLGNGGALDLFTVGSVMGSGGEGIRLAGDWTTSRHINFSNNNFVDTQANSAVWNGVVTGSGGLIKAGSGSLRINSANPFTGSVTVNAAGGEVRLAQNGTLLSSTFTVNNGGSLVLDNTVLPANVPGSGIVTTNRVVDSSSMTLASGGTLRLLGSSAAAVTEMLGTVTITGAGNVIQLDAFNNQAANLLINNLVTTNGTVLVRGTNLGQAGFAGHLFLNQFNGAAVTGGMILNNVSAENLNDPGVINQGIYDLAVGVRILNESDFTNGVAIQNGPPTNLPTTANFRVNPAVANPVPILDAANTINSLRFAPNGVANYNGAVDSTLTITSGSVFTEAGGTGASITRTGAGQLILTSGATPWTFTTNANFSVQANIAGTGGFTKIGAGDLLLQGAHTFTGGLNVNGGVLTLTSGSSLADGNALNVAAASVFNLGGNNAVFGAGTVNGQFNLGGAAVTMTTLAGNGQVNLGAGSLTLTGGAQTVAATISGAGGLVYNPSAVSLLTLSGANSYAGGTTGNAFARYIITNPTAFGTGAVDLTAQTATSSFSTPTVGFNFGANGTGTVANNFVLTTTAAIDQFFIARTSTGQTVRLTGVISGGSLEGTNRLVWDETGASQNNVLILDNPNNTFTGIVRPSFGTIAITSDGALGNVENDIQLQSNAGAQQGSLRFDADNITLNASRTVTVTGTGSMNTNGNMATVAGVVAGTTSFTKTGAGTLVLSNAGNTHTGAVNVNAGKLLVNGNIATGTNAVTVASGAALGGIGIINRPVTIASGGTLSPGASIGTLTVGGNVTINGNGGIGGWDIELNAVASNTPGTAAGAGDVDILALTGASNFNIVSSAADPLRLNLTALTTDFIFEQPVYYVLATVETGAFQTNGGLFSFDASAFVFNTNNFAALDFQLLVDGNRLLLGFSPVPEPSTWAMIGLVGAAAWTWNRRRRLVSLVDRK